jgi:gamma-glutamylcyclotransferase (GGCT)/AIG2-like uncharacterized protein YtfP
MNELVAVYGTLMTGMPAHPNRPDLTGLLELVDDCVLHGRLYSVGRYPALVHGAEPVRAQLMRTTAPDALDVLDRWEHYHPRDPARSMYRRVRLPAFEPKGLTAWVYLWNLPTDQLLSVRPADWRRWMDTSGMVRGKNVPKLTCPYCGQPDSEPAAA